MIKIGFSGTRHGMPELQWWGVRKLLSNYRYLDIEFHHGDCVGADAQAHDMAVEDHAVIVIHPPINPVMRAYRKSDRLMPMKRYIERNRAIVSECDVLIAAPRSETEDNSGTWSTIRFARLMKKKIWIVSPKGAVRGEDVASNPAT